MTYNILQNEFTISLPNREIFAMAFRLDEKGGALPAIILSHGYNASLYDVCDVAQALAQKGVFALCYDFCGGSSRSQSSGKSTNMSIKSEISDLNEVINYIQSLDFIDNKQIYLYGESQGGFVSALTADERIKALYLLYPAFCIPADWKNRAEKGLPEEFEFWGLTLSQRFIEGLPDYDIFEKISHYEGKAFIFQGTQDKIVKFHYAEKAAESFKNAQLFPFSGEGHGFSPKSRQELIALMTKDFS